MRTRWVIGAVVVALGAPAIAAGEVIPEAVPDLPVLTTQAHPGNDLITTPLDPVAPTPKVVDGQVDDWVGDITRLGGTAITSRGEYVYQDYVMDDWGADDGLDARRTEIVDPLTELEPRLYRPEIAQQAIEDQGGAPPPFGTPVHYGDAAPPEGLEDHADIEEVRIAADADTLFFLVRTTGMTEPDAAAVLVLIDTDEGGEFTHAAGVSSGAEREIRVIGSSVQIAQGADPTPCACDVARNADGFINAIEFSVPRAAVGATGPTIRIALATGLTTDGETFAPVKTGDAASDLINVAFRFDEPARVWMDHDQALALRDGNIDPFFTEVDLSKLETGTTEAFRPRPGYWERIYESDSPVVRETTSNSYWQGSFQHYGLYLPSTYDPARPTPATWWMHFRGGYAHIAAAWLPGLISQLGEARGNIMIFPGARGRSSWYLGRGHEDFLEVWEDAMASFPIDEDRVYMSGYSMGGYASWLLPLLYPDRFAASFPAASAVGKAFAWSGVGQYGGTDETDDGSEFQFKDAEPTLVAELAGNAANLGTVIYHGSNDELANPLGPLSMARELALRGYAHRYYNFLGAEHFTIAVYDEWTEAARYLDAFARDPNPARVVYTVKPSLERAVEQLEAPEGAALDYSFDGAYWVDDLLVRRDDPEDTTVTGTIDALSLGNGYHEPVAVPEAGTAGQIAPYVMHGIRRERGTFIQPRNEFSVDLANLARARLDVDRMGLSTGQPLTATVTTDGPVELLLDGPWSGAIPEVEGVSEWAIVPGLLRLEIEAAGEHHITISP